MIFPALIGAVFPGSDSAQMTFLDSSFAASISTPAGDFFAYKKVRQNNFYRTLF